MMEYLAGGSLKDRQASGTLGEWTAMPVYSLGEWLPAVAKALDFVHSQKHIHRDVKPANILFDRHGNAFLGDFGIIKGLGADESDCQGNALTMPGFLVGTPNYVAPEIVMGRPFDGRADQYSLAMTVHEVLSGSNCMEGPTPSATVVNQTMVVPPALSELMPGVPARLSDAILKGLAKNPADRFENCVAIAQEIMSAVPLENATADESALSDRTSRGVAGQGALSGLSGPDSRRSRACGGPRLLHPLPCHVAGERALGPEPVAQAHRWHEAVRRGDPGEDRTTSPSPTRPPQRSWSNVRGSSSPVRPVTGSRRFRDRSWLVRAPWRPSRY